VTGLYIFHLNGNKSVTRIKLFQLKFI